MQNKLIIYVTLIALILIIGIPTYIKVNNNYETRVILTIKNKIKVKAIQCWNENKCPNDKILITELYDNGYLEKVINPVTKKAVNDASYVIKKDDQITIKLFN